MSSLVICQYQHGKINKNNLKAISAAQSFAEPMILVLLADETPSDISTCHFQDVTQIYTLVHSSPQSVIKPLLQLCKEHSVKQIIANNNTFSKQILPQIAALLDMPMLTDVVRIIDKNTYQRPMYAGDFIATIKTDADIKIMSIRSSSFVEPRLDSSVQFNHKELEVTENATIHYQLATTDYNQIDLTTADIVITGGRGLGEGKNFALIYQLAEKLHAAVGATRAAVDAGWVDNALQVGQTGKVIAPKLYMAIGVSGAIQHLAGIKDAAKIIAINTDADAPLMQFADYAYQGDLFEAVPALLVALKDD